MARSVLSNPTNATLARAQGIGTILNDDRVCSPRPPVRVETVAAGPGQLSATVSAQTLPATPTNALSSIRLTRLDNAAVSVNGVPVTVGGSITLPGGTGQATLLVTRQAPGRAATVAFVVSDTCGEWPTFIGGGPSAF